MLISLITLVCLTSSAMSTVVDVGLYKQLILDIHNGYRRGLGSTNMQKLEWDNDLQAEAQDWARRCNFVHKNGQGENLAYNSYSITDKEHVESALESWYNETFHYRYSDLSCSRVCTHYTNIVWATTTKVGCGLEKCSNYLGFYTVCFYKPVGNWNGQYPYLTGGEPCSRCNPGQQCKDKLCTGISTKIIAPGIGPTGECKDHPKYASQCPGWKHSCTTNKNFMTQNCPKTCEFCGSSSSQTEDCIDVSKYAERCPGWKWSCKSNAVFMEPNCPKTCGICTSSTSQTTDCVDVPKYADRCPGWKWSCKSNAAFMEPNCPKTCGICTTN